MIRQFPLDLPHHTGFDAADYVEARSNAAGRALTAAWRDWPNRAAAVWGEAGAGKTHLARVWAATADARAVAANAFLGEDALAALAPPVRYAIDFGAEDLAKSGERALFHVLNAARETGGAVLLVSRQAPARWPVELPDLRSRLRALPAAEAERPDDDLFRAVMLKQFRDRQLVVDEGTVDYLLLRIERSFAAVRDIAARLDEASLARQRRITTRLAGDVLAEIETETK